MTLSKKDMLQWDADHYGHWVIPMGQNAGFVIEKSKGVSFYDTDGKEYLDSTSQLVCVSLGYKYNEEIDAAAAKQIEKLPYLTSFWGFTSDAVINCTRALAEIVPNGLDHFYLTNGGTESTELSFQLARAYWKKKGSKKHIVISLYNSYHGTSFAALAATGVSKGLFEKDYAPLLGGFIRAPSYYCYRCMLGLEYPECNIHCAGYIENLIELEGVENIAAIIVEPVHGTGGVIPAPPEYFPIIRRICDKLDVLLIADEVMTGFGRTGKAFGVDNWDVVPDMITMGKGISSSFVPLGGLAVNDKVWECLKGFVASGATYSGHPVAAAISTKVLEIYKRDKIFENAAAMGDYSFSTLKAELGDLPFIGEISGLGLMLGIEIVEDKKKRKGFDTTNGVLKKIRAHALEKGLLTRVTDMDISSCNRVAFTPPLSSNKDDIDRMLDILIATIKETLM